MKIIMVACTSESRFTHEGRSRYRILAQELGIITRTRPLTLKGRNHMKNTFGRIAKLRVLFATLLLTAATGSMMAQNKVIGMKPGANYSQGRVVGNMLFVAGLKGTPATGKTLADYDISAQTALALDAIKKVVEEAGFKMTDIVSVNAYLVDINDIDKMNEVYKKIMPDPKPVRVTVEVGHIRSGGRIEVSCIAIKQ
jgi:2-iminobutanoate/2-iminopropanoate deaminase